MTEEEFVGKLKRKAIEDNWNKIQGKGDSSANNQDLLSHSMDVVQITHNLINNLDLNTDYREAEFLATAFFHDLHKLDGLGGTESLETSEVEELLKDWDVKNEVLDSFSLQEFTDILKSIHQYTGSSESRTRVNSDTQLQRLAYVIRLADGIASTIEFNNLYEAGKWRSNREAVERLNQGLKQDYILGYHQLSEVKPAVGNLIHDAVRETVKDRGGIPVGSRKDGTVYLLPESFEGDELLEIISASAQDQFEDFRDDVPRKIQKKVFGPSISVDIAVDGAEKDLKAEGGDDDLSESYQRVIESVEGMSKGETSEWDIESDGSGLVDWNEDTEKIITSVPTTQKGYVVGDLLRDLVKKLNDDSTSRLEVLDNLVDINEDLSRFEDLNWRVKQSYLPKIVGNYAFQRIDSPVGEMIEQISEEAESLITGSSLGAVSKIRKYIEEVLTLDSDNRNLHNPEFSPEIDTGNSYEKLCISCGQEGEFDFRTTQTSPYSKSYMARGLQGESTSDDWDPKLCLSCFLDQTLMRALVRSDNSYISSMEDTIFLKVFPGRYLGTKQAKILRSKMEDYGSAEDDASDYLENRKEYEETVLDKLTADEDVSELNLDQTVSIGSMSGLVSSENYMLLAMEDSSDSPAKQVTKTWIKAVQKALIFRHTFNVDVEISNNAEISVDKPYPQSSGIILESPPSQIASVFGKNLNFDRVEENLDGISNLVYSTNYARAEGSNDLNIVYNEFKRSFYPGSRIYRATERKYDRPEKIDETSYQNIFQTCDSIDHWKSYITGASNMNRLQNIVDSFQISAKPNASTYMIQDPVRTLANKIMDADDESREEILDQASGEIYRRVERKWDNPDIYFGYGSDEDIKDLIYDGCAAFYDDVFQDMLDGNKIKLANQKNDILDGFYFIVRKRGVSE
jgi:HD superfamily phosphodiesterase